ncbi:hypothetical protein BDV37DRAFT_127715 [Aspergillus pseudonomiae]|uniref:Uncharacterized protein n=1 Tax=Aspergillus pseudonomiae TaxID=1506151 RepID=A0A5N7DBM8_9EURO|nr:uncharacterized protein BDV37DRAFT_127715 [Aspergillus pseudonomiae]KAE8403792.1 hypothetical protein BDV37DRAFT_127715 [Aspergillus pseudonomiae]
MTSLLLGGLCFSGRDSGLVCFCFIFAAWRRFMKCIPPFGCCCCCCAQRCRYRFQPTDQCADPSEYPKFKQIQNNIYKTKDLLMFLVDEFPKHRREEKDQGLRQKILHTWSRLISRRFGWLSRALSVRQAKANVDHRNRVLSSFKPHRQRSSLRKLHPPYHRSSVPTRPD